MKDVQFYTYEVRGPRELDSRGNNSEELCCGDPTSPRSTGW